MLWVAVDLPMQSVVLLIFGAMGMIAFGSGLYILTRTDDDGTPHPPAVRWLSPSYSRIRGLSKKVRVRLLMVGLLLLVIAFANLRMHFLATRELEEPFYFAAVILYFCVARFVGPTVAEVVSHRTEIAAELERRENEGGWGW